MQTLKKPKNASIGYFRIFVKDHTHWYLRHAYYVENKVHEITVPRGLYNQFGFKLEWSIEEAKKRCKQLNSERKLEYGQHVRTGRRAEAIVKADKTYFPEEYIEQFLEELESQTFGSEKHLKKLNSHFAIIQKMIKTLKLTPDKYTLNSAKIYKYFIENEYSIDYSNKLLRMLNAWGVFIARRQGSFFAPVKSPRGTARSAIETAQATKNGIRRESLPLLPEQLQKAKMLITKEHYNWLFISVWFGLRPEEIDMFKNQKTWKITEQDRTKILHIYQSKLTSIQSADRWKYIPILFPEQKKALEIIKSGEFKRPHSKTIQKHLGVGITQYGGRKGFEALMTSKGQHFEDVVDWLGHKSIETTWKRYRNHKKVRWSKVS